MLYLNGIVAGPDGALWVTEYAGTIYRVTTSGQITYFNVAVTGFGHPQGLLSGIAVGPDRALWFTEVDYAQGIQHIGRITISGNVIYYPVNATGSNFIGNITSGIDDTLWFVDGVFIGRMTTAGAVTLYPARPNNDLAKAPDGSIFFTAGNQIGRISLPPPNEPILTWQNNSSSDVVGWYVGGPGASVLENFQYIVAGTQVGGWRLAASADFNNDSVYDLIWQHIRQVRSSSGTWVGLRALNSRTGHLLAGPNPAGTWWLPRISIATACPIWSGRTQVPAK